MDIEYGRVIARLQRLTAELLADSAKHRDAIIRADAQAWRLIEWAKIMAPEAVRPRDGR